MSYIVTRVGPPNHRAKLTAEIAAALRGHCSQELTETLQDFAIPFVPIVEESHSGWSTAPDLSKYPWFLWPPVTFSTTDDLLLKLQKAIVAPAEKRSAKRREQLSRLLGHRD